METQRASLSLGRWSLWLLLLGLVLPSASAQAYSYRRAVLRAVDQFNEQSSEANLYRLLELDPPPEQDVEDHSARKPVSFRVKETICPRRSLQPPEQCDFRENGLVKQCVGTVTLYQSRGDSDITCNDIQSVGIFGRLRDKIRRGGQKILDKVKRIGQRIRYFFPG
ncbi:cathelicidin-7-like [Cervus elaphus]|uniref:cathelicidin-7-like n=1 Tax=Cervus elaphus TaxID=9860 RepID=UPI001CC2E2E1|nr:cathelicidin-7-like [Cervus elaphus]